MAAFCMHKVQYEKWWKQKMLKSKKNTFTAAIRTKIKYNLF